jgi:hypothetical protein
VSGVIRAREISRSLVGIKQWAKAAARHCERSEAIQDSGTKDRTFGT